MSNLNELLVHALDQNQISVSAEQINLFARYLDLMRTWNKVYNLTNITAPRDMVYLHIIDSLSIRPYLHGKRCLDVGSGAGLPGIPLAILNPEQEWVLLDKVNKKTRFMTQAVAELQLKNVSVVHSRCEDFQPGYCFDSILSRAFGTIRMFIEVTQHVLCPNGIYLAMKGKYPAEELNDMPDGFMMQNVSHLDIKGIDIERHVATICRKK